MPTTSRYILVCVISVISFVMGLQVHNIGIFHTRENKLTRKNNQPENQHENNQGLQRSFQNWCFQCIRAVQTSCFQNTSANNFYSLAVEERAKCLDEFSENVLLTAARADGYILTGAADVLYIGGHRDALVGRQMREANRNITKLVVFEPHPLFFEDLQTTFDGDSSVVLKNAGLGEFDGTVLVSNTGKSTTIFDNHINGCGDSSCARLKILKAGPVLESFVRNSSYERILYTNCEGCEISVLESLVAQNLAKQFKYIHFATHYLKSQNDYGERLCKIRERLSLTHELVIGIDFAQERYMRNDF